MKLRREDARTAAKGLGWARVALGVIALTVPGLPGRLWIGEEAGERPVKVLARALGARDVALGLGAVLALGHDAPVRGWVEAGGLADAGDLVATLLAFGALPRWGRWGVLAAAGGGAAASRLLAPVVD